MGTSQFDSGAEVHTRLVGASQFDSGAEVDGCFTVRQRGRGTHTVGGYFAVRQGLVAWCVFHLEFVGDLLMDGLVVI